MKTYIVLMTVILNCYISQCCSQSVICGANCFDRWNNIVCLTQIKQCQTNVLMRSFCSKTCGACVSDCKATNVAAQKCTMDCADRMPSFSCQVIKNTRQNGCQLLGHSCQLTCGLCSKCPTPPPPCTYDCKDLKPSCADWKKQKYCETKSDYHGFMQEHCPLTCGTCKACPTPPPKNTALPPPPAPKPTRPACLPSGCEDTDPSCEHWADEGHCNETGPYPYTMEVCPKSCKVCEPCPANLLPPPAPTKPECSKDCVESNEECEFWRSEGYCESTSEHNMVMKQFCPITCNYCVPCKK